MRDILQSRYLRRRVAHKQLARTSLSRAVNVSFVCLPSEFYPSGTVLFALFCRLEFFIVVSVRCFRISKIRFVIRPKYDWNVMRNILVILHKDKRSANVVRTQLGELSRKIRK